MKTFGTLHYAENTRAWLVDCEPHVVLKLKRVFPKVNAKQHGTIKLTDTVEVCRELEWFMERYPLAVDAPTRKRLTARARVHREQESLVADLLSGVREARAFELAIPAREYQRVAADLCLAQGGLLLADDLGIGKTCTGICVISEPSARPALVVTLTHLPKQWEAEVKRFAPQLRTHVIKKGTPYDVRQVRGSKRGQLMLTEEFPDVIITSYSKLRGWAETLAPIIRSVVFDEAQELRRDESAKTAAARHLAEHATYRLGLTATPIYNYGNEIFHVIDAVRPGALGTKGEFLEEWCTAPDSQGRAKIVQPDAFGTYVRDSGLMLRRTRAEVGRELPALTKVPHHVESDESYLDKIDSAATRLAQVILKTTASARGDSFRASGELDMLVRQATGLAKAPYVADFVRMIVETGEPVVLYGWHRAVYDVWLDRLKDFAPALYTGSESPAQKEEARRRFVSGETPILIMSLRSGAGLDGLQHHARTVVFGELDWSPGVHEQCAGRLHRDGQSEPVVAYYLLADSGSDPIVADVLGMKASQIAGIRDLGGDLVESLQSDGDHVKRLAQAYLARRAS